MKRIISSLLLFHVLCVYSFPQELARVSERDLWRMRADVLTSNLLKDASNRESLDRALLMAQLSDLWWDSNPTQANTWIQKSVDTIWFYPAEEARQHREKFLSVARQVLALVATRNKKQSARLVEILNKSASDKDIADLQKTANAESLIAQAVKLVKDDPAQAAKIGVRALSLGLPANADNLALDLRRSNPALAEQFSQAAFSSLSATSDLSNVQIVQQIVFPDANYPTIPARLLPSRELRIMFLEFVADYLLARQMSFSSKAVKTCMGEAVLASRMREGFRQLLPQKSALVEQSIAICLASMKTETKQLLERRDNETANVEELLKVAEKVEGDGDFYLRGVYLMHAAVAAHSQKKYAQAIEILEKMKEEEREIAREFWEELRFDSAAGFAASVFKEGDVTRANKILNDVPDRLRPLAQVTFAFQFPPEDVSCSQFCVEQLDEARRGFVKGEMIFKRKSWAWLILVKLYSIHKLQTEASETFREMVKAFNHSRSGGDASQDDGIRDQFISEARRTVPEFSPMLFEAKEDSMFESIKLLDDEKSRAELTLVFLKAILERYKSLKAQPEKKQTTQ